MQFDKNYKIKRGKRLAEHTNWVTKVLAKSLFLPPRPPADAVTAPGFCVAFCELVCRCGRAAPAASSCRTRQRSHPGPARSPAGRF